VAIAFRRVFDATGETVSGDPSRKMDDDVVKVDVVVVNYHSGRVLSRAIEAAEAFLGDAARLFIVDNSVGDGAVQTVRELVPEATVIENDRNRGFAAAVNQAVAAGDGEVVLLLNPDIGQLSGSFAGVDAIFRSNARVGAVAVRLLNADGSVQRLCRHEPRLRDMLRPEWWQGQGASFMPEWDYRTQRRVDVACGACLFLRRSALADVGPFDERFFVYYEETDWLVRAKVRGWWTVFTPDVEAVHPGGSSTPRHQRESLLLLESQHKYARKHFGIASSLLLRATFVAYDFLRWLRSLPGMKRAPRRGMLQRRLKMHLAPPGAGIRVSDRRAPAARSTADV
jgi:N-acetylglucosaminyl-diphospho-decaprenol L-rhamnosyltransferase